MKIFGVEAKEMSGQRGLLVDTDLWQLQIRKRTHLSLYLRKTAAVLTRSFTTAPSPNLEVYQQEIEDQIHMMLRDHSRGLADVCHSMPSGARTGAKTPAFTNATKAYLALGEALKTLAEQHEQLEAYKKHNEAIEDMNKAKNLAAKFEDFKVGDLVRFPGHDTWIPVESCVGACVEVAGHRWLPTRRKTVREGDTVRVKNGSFTGLVKTIQRNEIGIAWAWFAGDECARVDDCIAIAPSSGTT